MYSTTSSGMPRSASTLRRICLSAGSLSANDDHALGQVLQRAAVDAHDRARRVPGLRERVEHLADALALGVDDVEDVVLELALVRDVVHRGGDVVDRDDVRPAPLEADQREPLRQRVPDLLQQLEEVVRPVDLVHLAGLGVADDDRRAVDAQRGLHALADETLGLELRPVVRVGQLLALVEHVLGERAVVVNRPATAIEDDVVEHADVEAVREVDRVLRAADVDLRVALLVRGHVVDRGEVEEVVDPREVELDAELGLARGRRSPA